MRAIIERSLKEGRKEERGRERKEEVGVSRVKQAYDMMIIMMVTVTMIVV